MSSEHAIEGSEVHQALDAILASPPFRKSRQHSALLHYIVLHSLRGEDNLLRERVIGAEVFGRQPDYDPGEDPVVRLRVSEMRKRLAQAYHSEELRTTVLIEVPPGAYRANFKDREAGAPGPQREAIPDVIALSDAILPEIEVVAPPHEDATTVVRAESLHPRRWRLPLFFGVVALIVLNVVALFLLVPHHRQTVLEAFWAPLLAPRQAVTLCVPDYTVEDLQQGRWPERIAAVIAGNTTHSKLNSDASSRLPLAPWIDSVASSRVSYWLGSQRIAFESGRTSQLTINDLRRQPAVLIGAFDNDWALVFLSHLRFHVQIDPKTYREWIEDTKHPGFLGWRSSGDLPYGASSVDFAIISRILQPETGQWIVAIGGLGTHGTEAAADLVTQEKLSYLLPSAVKDQKRNVQIVVKTYVIDGRNSLPEVIAVETWPI